MTILIRNLRAICSSQHFPMFSSGRSSHYPFLPSNQFSSLSSPRSSLCHQEGSMRRWSFQAHSSSSETQARLSFLPWGLAGLCLGAYLFGKDKSWIGSVYGESQNNPHLVFARREDNEKLTPEQLRKSGIHLEIDPEAITTDQSSQVWYKIKHPDFAKSPFRVRLEGGQLLWQAFDVVNEENEYGGYRDDITPIARLYATFQSKRTLVVNTGIHGNAEGDIAYGTDGTDFVKGDMDIFLPGNFATVHIVAPGRPAYTHEEEHAQAKDILDAWCYSAKRDKSKNFVESEQFAKEVAEFRARCRCGGRYLSSFEDVLASFGLLGYKAETKKDENIEYVPLKKCSQLVQAQLNESSRCYIRGDGGRGKSRLSLEIQESAQEKKEVYIDTVRIALRTLNDPLSDDWSNFMKHVRKVVGEDSTSAAIGAKIKEFISFNEEEALKAYFLKLGTVAEKAGKKYLVIIDNVDDLKQDEKLSLILSAINSYRPQKEGQNSPFHLLVTGRLLFNRGAFGKDQIVDIASYWDKDSIWSLFSENFLKDCKYGSKESARRYIEPKSEMLRERFKEFDNITAFIVTIAKLLAGAYNDSGPTRADHVLKTLTPRIQAILRRPVTGALGDYRLGYLLPALLETLATKNQKSNISAEDANCIFELLALISNGKIPEDVLRAVFLQFTSPRSENAKIIADMHFEEIIKAMEEGALILKEGNPDEKMISMSSNYNFLMRGMLLAEYGGENEKRRREIHEQIMAAATVLHERLETTDRGHQEEVRKYLKLLLSLMSYSSTELVNSVSSFVSEEHKAKSIQANAKEFLAPIEEKTQKLIVDRLVTIPFCELGREYESFFSKIPHLEGYSVSPQLVLLNTPQSSDQISGLIKKLEKSKGAEKSKVARELNNCFVIAKMRSLPCDEKRVQDALRKAKGSEDFDHITGEEIGKNLENQNYAQWAVFPEIRLLEISPEDRLRATNWWNKNKSSLETTGTANFSGQKFGKNLSLLTLHLLKQQNVILKKVDLSNNDLGSEKAREPSVCMLLQFASYLETLDFSHNYLFRLSSENLETIMGMLEHHQSVKTLILHHNSLGDAEIADLCNKLEKLKSLEKLYLHANSFGEKGLKELEDLMKKNKSIQFITTALSSEESWLPYVISNRMTRGYWSSHDTTKTLRRTQNGEISRDKEKLEPLP